MIMFISTSLGIYIITCTSHYHLSPSPPPSPPSSQSPPRQQCQQSQQCQRGSVAVFMVLLITAAVNPHCDADKGNGLIMHILPRRYCCVHTHTHTRTHANKQTHTHTHTHTHVLVLKGYRKQEI